MFLADQPRPFGKGFRDDAIALGAPLLLFGADEAYDLIAELPALRLDMLAHLGHVAVHRLADSIFDCHLTV